MMLQVLVNTWGISAESCKMPLGQNQGSLPGLSRFLASIIS